ncbi:MAG: hypothetical protein Q7J98_12725, partial [Kiritimatiellia bacterium]|nr:hypothetical protein [Kiritimatiellia bacterium]
QQCRKRFDELDRKFQQLDLLKEDASVAPAMIAKIVRKARDSERPYFGKIVRLPARNKFVIVLAVAALAMLTLFFMPRFLTSMKSGVKEAGIRKVSESAQEPFLPASNIELNVLPKRDAVQVTIYNAADLTLVREQRKLTLKKGWNWLQFMWANTLIDPTSLSFEPKGRSDLITIHTLTYPPRMNCVGRWLIFSEISGEAPVEITYFTSGLSWHAFYTAILTPDEKEMKLEGYVRVDNRSGEDYGNAQTRLVVGEVHLKERIAELARRPHAFGEPRMRYGRGSGGGGMAFGGAAKARGMDKKEKRQDENEAVLQEQAKEIMKEGLSEYFLYTIEGTENLRNNWGKRLPSFSTNGIPVVSLYKYDDERWGTNVMRFVSFKNDKEHKIGETPIPEGQCRVFQTVDASGSLSYEGASRFKYIPVGEKAELNLGGVTDVKIQNKVMDERAENFIFDSLNNIVGWDEIKTCRLEIRNTRAGPVKTEIIIGLRTPYWRVETAEQGVYSKHDATHMKFMADVPARSARTITYTVTKFMGMREEQAIKQ